MNTPDFHPESTLVVRQRPAETRKKANGLEHHVLEWGRSNEGIPIVLAHGFMDHAWSFQWLAGQLAQTRRVFAFSWRGHGETDRIGPGGYYHFPDYVLDLHELIPQLAERYHLFGHSMGGTACALFAGTQPRGLVSLTLAEGLGPPAGPLDQGADRLADFVKSVRNLRSRTSAPIADLDDAMRRLKSRHGELDSARLRFLAEKGTHPRGSELEWHFDPLHRTTSPTPFSLESFRALLSRIAVPVLVMSGDRGFRTTDHADRVARIADARELVIEDVGHMLHWFAVETVASALLAHTAAAESSPPGLAANDKDIPSAPEHD